MLTACCNAFCLQVCCSTWCLSCRSSCMPKTPSARPVTARRSRFGGCSGLHRQVKRQRERNWAASAGAWLKPVFGWAVEYAPHVSDWGCHKRLLTGGSRGSVHFIFSFSLPSAERLVSLFKFYTALCAHLSRESSLHEAAVGWSSWTDGTKLISFPLLCALTELAGEPKEESFL